MWVWVSVGVWICGRCVWRCGAQPVRRHLSLRPLQGPTNTPPTSPALAAMSTAARDGFSLAAFTAPHSPSAGQFNLAALSTPRRTPSAATAASLGAGADTDGSPSPGKISKRQKKHKQKRATPKTGKAGEEKKKKKKNVRTYDREQPTSASPPNQPRAAWVASRDRRVGDDGADVSSSASASSRSSGDEDEDEDEESEDTEDGTSIDMEDDDDFGLGGDGFGMGGGGGGYGRSRCAVAHVYMLTFFPPPPFFAFFFFFSDTTVVVLTVMVHVHALTFHLFCHTGGDLVGMVVVVVPGPVGDLTPAEASARQTPLRQEVAVVTSVVPTAAWVATLATVGCLPASRRVPAPKLASVPLALQLALELELGLGLELELERGGRALALAGWAWAWAWAWALGWVEDRLVVAAVVTRPACLVPARRGCLE